MKDLFSDIFIIGDIKRVTTAVAKLYSVKEATMSYKDSPNNHLQLHSRHQQNDQYSDHDESVISEGFRTAISVLYYFTVSFLSAFGGAVAHDRLPDTNSYPPLPDVFLDNIPLIPGSLAICEICSCVMMFFWILILIFHKHRFVVLRRSCAILGTIFLLRCFTIYVTSLSVPAKHSECFPTVSYFLTYLYYIFT